MASFRHEIQSISTGLSFAQRHAYKWGYLGLLVSDILSLALALGISVLLRERILGPGNAWSIYQSLLPVMLLLAVLIYAFQGQYHIGGAEPVTELRSLSLGTCFIFLILTALTFFSQTSTDYSRLIFALTWGFSLLFVPVSRSLLRVVAARLGIWGEPVTILGGGPTSLYIVDHITQKAHLGWRPIAVIGPDIDKSFSSKEKITQLKAGSDSQFKRFINLYKTNTIIIIQSEVPKSWLEHIHKPFNRDIRKFVVVPEIDRVQSTVVKTHNIAGSLGLEIQQSLLSPWGQLLKRGMDVFLAIAVGILILPIVAILAIAIKLDSRGSVFYAQTRLGHKGNPFQVWKFRTMVQNAEQILQEYLAKYPQKRAEWEANQKLKDDPRITRVGKFIRKLSLDELPQLWNVFKGEMSIIGPRPCMPEQQPLYGEIWDLYISVRPGLTGLWQVSGRNNTTYEERVRLDEYYVRNWSIWLDIYILAKTVWVVLSREGAY